MTKWLNLFRNRPAAEKLPSPSPEAQAAAPGNELRVQTKWLDQTYAVVEHHDQSMRFATTGKSSFKRVRSLFEKEPITLAWIDSFGREQVLYDVGANVGMYTIYAAIMRQAQVYSFEPEALNYAELNKNIYLNGLHGQVMGYCLALSDVDKIDRLLLSDFGLGISYHDFEENSWTEDKKFSPDWIVTRNDRKPQGCIGRRLDSLVADGLPFPDHIKIDVDGLEHRVVSGMTDLLRNPKLKTMLIEINFDNPKNLALIDDLVALGWRFSWAQLRINRKVKFTVEQIKGYQARGVGGLNYIFYRDAIYDSFFANVFERYVPGVSLNVEDLIPVWT
ncbi:FkbM family methyltransferase [Sphingorhabdus sp. EL138]|uniref:FkbM family methyltransferase n=1 Tax=Sphingorhabdus sp. EL138 TaxID=2073156 RepID=UPI0025FD8ACC|nr:FkbM family methyltransferase [Sphingorhabdus sp. EL138]